MRLPTFSKARTINWLQFNGFSDEINATAFTRETIFTHAGYAYMAAAALYLLSGYADAIVPAITQINQQHAPKHTDSFYTQEIVTLTATALAGVLLYRLLRVALGVRFSDPDPTQLSKTRRVIGRSAFYVLFVVIAGSLPHTGMAALLGTESSYPQLDQETPVSVAHTFVHAATSGFNEELFLVALPVLLLRAGRRPWWEIITLLTVVRMSFHLYYGWPVLGMLPWALGAILIYRYTHSIAPLIIGHAFFDVSVFSIRMITSDEALLIFPALVLIAAAIGKLGLTPGKQPSTNQTRISPAPVPEPRRHGAS
jgi:hypothetical protein